MTDKRRINSGYVITASVPAGNKEFVLGVNQTAPEQYVTWECKDGDYIWGHYTDSPLKALKDLCGRILEEVEYLEILSIPGITVGEIGSINGLQKSIRSNQVISFLTGGVR